MSAVDTLGHGLDTIEKATVSVESDAKSECYCVRTRLTRFVDDLHMCARAILQVDVVFFYKPFINYVNSVLVKKYLFLKGKSRTQLSFQPCPDCVQLCPGLFELFEVVA